MQHFLLTGVTWDNMTIQSKPTVLVARTPSRPVRRVQQFATNTPSTPRIEFTEPAVTESPEMKQETVKKRKVIDTNESPSKKKKSKEGCGCGCSSSKGADSCKGKKKGKKRTRQSMTDGQKQ